MPLQSHYGRLLPLLCTCLIALFLVLRAESGETTPPTTFSTQYARRSFGNPTNNDTLGFEKIFVINAPWRTDRRDSMSLAASYSGMSLDWIDGVDAKQINEKAFPPGNHRRLPQGNVGSWRAHMDALRTIIEQNFTTALVVEDDVDWDFRIHAQLERFSHAARELPDLLSQADLHKDKNIDVPLFEQGNAGPHLNPVELAKLSSTTLPNLSIKSGIPKTDPYGRAWDILWLGHCGAKLPPPSPFHPDRIMLLNDGTVALPQHLKPTSNHPMDEMAAIYPPQTRLIHRANTTACTLAYAVTQHGARKLLYEFGVREFSKGYDFALSDYCNGWTRGGAATSKTAQLPLCIAVNPPIFGHYFGEDDGGGGARGGSDIMGTGMGGREVGTRYVRASVRGSLEQLVRGWRVEERWGE